MLRVRRGVLLFCSVLVIGALCCLLYIWRDASAIEERKAKALELTQFSESMRNRDLGAVLAELGQPTIITFERGTVPGISGRHHPARLRLTYEYGFRTFPWSYPQRAVLHVFVNLADDGRLDGTWTDQTFGR